MELLSKLSPAKGSKRSRKRVGRGTGSGHGKTCGTGHNGQNSRAGAARKRGFEGGQTPLARRLPKFGFTNIFREEYEIVNIGKLATLEMESNEVTPELMIKKNLVRSRRKIKILGEGDIKVALIVTANKFSKQAEEKIVAAGGQVKVVRK
ncbi:MAG: 50S ribosomal protein L15 [Nitrospinota bacterium]